MASGKFTAHNKLRPGAYFNFASGRKQTGVNASGIIAMTMPFGWGNLNSFVEITSQTNLFSAVGHNIEENSMVLLREALKTAQKVLLFNVAGTGSSRATGTLTAQVTITAKKYGVLGNRIQVVIAEEMDDTFTVSTFFKNTLVDKQAVSTVADYKENGYITLAGEGALEETAGITLTGGETAASTNENYLEFFKQLESKDFYAFCIDTEDDTIKQTAVTYTKKWRDQEGKKVVYVAADLAADFEGVVNVSNGVILTNGVKLSALECTPYVAGLMASVGTTQSLTYHSYEGAIDANPRMMQTEVEDALMTGKFIFTAIQDNVVVEQDINSLTTFAETKNKDFRKNKFIRIIDTLHVEMLTLYSNGFIGKTSNNEDGRELLKKDVLALLEQLKNNNAIDEYESDDVEVIAGGDSDVVVINMRIKVADAMEKAYVTVTLN